MPEVAPPDRQFIAQDRRFAATLRGDVLAAALTCCVEAGRNETGGVILGRYSETLDCAEIHELGPPPPGSRATRTSFYRGIGGLQERLRLHWREGLYYLGEWHFHPFAAPTPSTADIQQIQAISTDSQYHCPEPLLIIVGADPRELVRLGVFVCPRGGRIVELAERRREAVPA